MATTTDSDPRVSLHIGFREDDYDSLLDRPVESFVGIDRKGAAVLRRLGVRTVFELANAPVFGAAAILQAAAHDPDHPFRLLGRIDPDLVDGTGTQLPVDEWPLQPIRMISGLGEVLAPEVQREFDLHTIGELATWGPYVCAVEIVHRAVGLPDAPATDTGTPVDLLPANGEYPTDKVYYRNLFARDFDDSEGGIELSHAAGLDLSESLDTTSTGIGHGALVTWEQLWYGQGLVLGNLLHSLALAPGEATMIAIVDWTREVSASTVESVEQLESLQASTSQNRALSEVTSGVVSEIQSGFSTTQTSGTTTGVGATAGGAGGISIPIPDLPVTVSLGGGGGLSGGVSHTSGTAMTVTSSSGSRASSAEYGQQISESTQQQANSARSRRASIVQEVRESTSEQLQTRVVANYNHMHAMSVCYYEIVQIYRVVLQVARAEKCVFVPMVPLDFNDDAVIERFAGILGAVSANPYVQKVVATPIGISLVAPVAGATYVRLPLTAIAIPTHQITPNGARARKTTGRPQPAPGTAIPAALDGTDWWQAGQVGFAVTVPGPIEVSTSARLTFVEGSMGTQTLGVTLNLTDRSVGISGTDIDEAFLEVRSIDLSLPTDPSGEVSLEFGVTSGNTEQHYRVTMATDGAEPTPFGSVLTALVVVGGEVSATDVAMAKAELTANAAWYTARIWERLDTTAVSALLARYRYHDKPLVSAVDPRVVAVTGSHVVFRLLLDADAEVRWARELDQWGLTGPASRRDDVVPLPTGGVFAEAVLGRANSAEVLDMTRFWNWQDSPPPFAPPAIADLQAGQETPTPAPVPGGLDAPIVQMMQPNPLPDPTGVAATLGLLGSSGIFRDMSFGDANVAAASGAAAVSAAAQMAAVAAAQQAFATAAALSGNASYTGALMNAAKDGLPGAYERLVPPSPAPPEIPDSPGTPDGGGTPPPTGGGTPGGGGGDGSTPGRPGPSGPPGDTSGDIPGDGSETPSGPEAPTTRDLHLRLAVAAVGAGVETSYDWVRLDAADVLLAMVPSELTDLVQLPLRILDAWIGAVGLNGSDGSTLNEAVEFLGTWASGAGEAATVIAAIKSIIDLLGLEDVTPGSVAEQVLNAAWKVVHLLEAVFLPAISGGEWFDVTVRTRVSDGVGTAAVVESQTPQIHYGLLSAVQPVAGWPAWAGRAAGGAALLTTDATFDPDTLTVGADVEDDGSFLLTISGGMPLALDWESVVRNHVPILEAAVEDVYDLVSSETDALSGWMASLGIEDDFVAALKASAGDWFEWWATNYYRPLNDFLVPQVDFTFQVHVEADEFGSWSVRTTPEHDQFPRYHLDLVGTQALGTVALYDGPDGLAASIEGPFALAAPETAPGQVEEHTVPAEWFDPWSG